MSSQDETKIIEQDNIIFSLNFKNSTASVINNANITGNVYIPKSLNYESQDFIIKSINHGSFKQARLKSLQFSIDSEVSKIEDDVFAFSSIESLILPESIKNCFKDLIF